VIQRRPRPPLLHIPTNMPEPKSQSPAASFASSFLWRKVQTERRLIACPGNSDGQYRHPILAEKRIEWLQQERFEPRGDLRKLRLQPQCTAEIQRLVPQPVGAGNSTVAPVTPKVRSRKITCPSLSRKLPSSSETALPASSSSGLPCPRRLRYSEVLGVPGGIRTHVIRSHSPAFHR
jgi:hypothetical protein